MFRQVWEVFCLSGEIVVKCGKIKINFMLVWGRHLCYRCLEFTMDIFCITVYTVCHIFYRTDNILFGSVIFNSLISSETQLTSVPTALSYY